MAPVSLTPPLEVLRLNFLALWNNNAVGSYSFLITPSADGRQMTVSHTFLIRVKIAFVTMFRYEHRVEEVWRDGQLQRLTSETVDADGTMSVRGARAGQVLRIEGPLGLSEAPADMLTTTCAWHPAFTQQKGVVDVSDGRVVDLVVRSLGETMVKSDGDDVAARQYAFTSPYLAGLLWYRPERTLIRAEIEKKGHRVAIVAQS